MPELLYTQEDIDRLKQEWESDLFAEKTNDTFRMVIKRLDESNGYKATIGKDVKSALARLDTIEARFQAEDDAKEKAERKKVEKTQWYQDWWIRSFGIATVIWEILNIYQAAGGSVHGIVR